MTSKNHAQRRLTPNIVLSTPSIVLLPKSHTYVVNRHNICSTENLLKRDIIFVHHQEKIRVKDILKCSDNKFATNYTYNKGRNLIFMQYLHLMVISL